MLIMNRGQFRYLWSDSWKHMIYRVIKCFSKCCLCCNRLCKRSSLKYAVAEEKHKLFEKGKQLMTRDLDIVKLIQRNQIYDVNEQVLYNQRERFFLQF